MDLEEGIYFDDTDNIIHASTDLNYIKFEPKGLGYAYFKLMEENKDIIAQIDTDTDQYENFGSLRTRCIRTAIELKNRNIMPGDIISICSSNNLDNLIPVISAAMIGAIVASFDPKLPLSDTTHLMKQITPKIIFISNNSEELIEDTLRESEIDVEVVVFGDSNKYVPFAIFTEPKDEEDEFEPYEVTDLKETTAILFSSGTTGLAKGICLNHYSLMYQAFTLGNTGANYDVMLSFASTYWISTIVCLNIMIFMGKSRCIIPTYNPKEIWYDIEKYKVSFMFSAPSQAMSLLKAGRPDNVDTTSLQDILIGGGPFSSTSNIAFRDLLPGTHVHQIYGQSEAAGLVTAFRPISQKDVILLNTKTGSCGRPMAGFRYKIVDPESEETLGMNEKGELHYFYEGQMNGYYNRDSSEAYDENGWICSGDIAYFDEDFCFYIVGRFKEMLKFQGFHVVPAKIESIILTHPKVSSVAVIGVPDEEDGDHPLAFIVLQPDETATEDEIVEFVEERVEDRSRLRAGVRFIDELPYTPSGKIKKQTLLKSILAGY